MITEETHPDDDPVDPAELPEPEKSWKDRVMDGVKRISDQVVEMSNRYWRLEQKVSSLPEGTAEEAAKVLVSRYLASFISDDKQRVFDALTYQAGKNLSKELEDSVKPEILLGAILERAGIELTGKNGLISQISTAAQKLAKDENFIRSLVERELKRPIRLAVRDCIEEEMLKKTAKEVADKLVPNLPFDTFEAMRDFYYDEWQQHGCIDFAEAVRMGVHTALVEVCGCEKGKRVLPKPEFDVQLKVSDPPEGDE